MGYVYLICDPSAEQYKIGVTRGSIEKRLKKLQTGNGTPLHLVSYHETKHPFKIEAFLHLKFRDKRTLNEWFQLNNEDIANFNDTCQIYETILESVKENHFMRNKLG